MSEPLPVQALEIIPAVGGGYHVNMVVSWRPDWATFSFRLSRRGKETYHWPVFKTRDDAEMAVAKYRMLQAAKVES